MAFKWDNHISLGHLLTTVTIAIAGFGWVVSIERQVQQNADEINALRRLTNEQIQTIRSSQTRIEENLRTLSQEQRQLLIHLYGGDTSYNIAGPR